MRVLSFIFAFLGAISLSGCASYFKRKECEKTNWHQHGYNVAMAGKRLDADDFVRECQKVEAKMSFSEMDTGFKAGMNKYCTVENIFDVGKSGKKFSFEMCDGENQKKMRARYQEGLRVFCTPSSAYRFGSAGGLYEGVCPDTVENEWLVEYRRGRKIFLAATIAEKEKEVARLDGEISRLESQRSALTIQQSNLTHATTVRRERVYDPTTGTYREQTTTEQDPNSKMRADQINNELFSLNGQIQRTRQQQDEVNTQLSKMRTELATL
jgi:hypothetical protein